MHQPINRRQAISHCPRCSRQPASGHRTEALRLTSLGAHSLAEAHLERALAVLQTDPACADTEILDAWGDLACCRFNEGRYGRALQDFLGMQSLIQEQARPDVVRAQWVSDQIVSCQKALAGRTALAVLQGGVSAMLKRARTEDMATETARQERLRLLGRRLIERGRLAAGTQLMARWIDQLLCAELPDSDDALNDIRDHGLALWHHGDLPHAEHALRAVVILLNHRQHARRDSVALRRALTDWEACIQAKRARLAVGASPHRHT